MLVDVIDNFVVAGIRSSLAFWLAEQPREIAKKEIKSRGIGRRCM